MVIFTGAASQTMKCFVAGTMILTATALVVTENIKAGDKVTSTNTETGETAEKAVLEVAPLGDDFLKSKGFSDADIFDIKNGDIPDGYNIHHKYPLDDGGTNANDNLILIKQTGVSDHQNFTDYQNSITSGLKPGETKIIGWPAPTGKVYYGITGGG